MSEPASSITGVAIAAGTVTLTGSVLGVQYDMLLAGFFGGLVSLSYLPTMTIMRIIGTVATSSLIAGFFAPVVAVIFVNYLPFLSSIGDFTRMSTAAGLGLCAQVLIPVVFDRIRRFESKK